MTAEEAKKILDDVLNKEAYGYMDYLTTVGKTDEEEEDYINALDCAVEALDKKIPKKPVGRHTEMHCPVCGTRVRSGNGSSSRVRDTVCRHCYQVLDWSDEERCKKLMFTTEEIGVTKNDSR